MLLNILSVALTKWTLIFMICFGLAIPCASQNKNIVDSLRYALEGRTGGDRFPVLYELTFQYLDVDNEKALMFIKKAGQAALLSGDSLWIVKSKRVKGQILYRLQHLEDAIVELQGAINVAKRNGFENEEQHVAATLGSAFIFTSSLAKALEYNLRSWELWNKDRDKMVHYEYLNNIGVTYYKLGDFSKALKYYVKASEAEGLGVESRANLFVNIALCYSYLDQFENARIWLRKSYDECRAGCSDVNVMHSKFAVGLNFYRSAMRDSAEMNFVSSLQHAEALTDQRMISDNIYFLADIYLDRDSLLQAKPLVHKAVKLAEDINAFPDTKLHAYRRLSEFNLKTGRFAEAALYQAKYIELNDSIYSQEYTVRLMAKEVEFAQQQNQAKIEAQAEALRLNREIVARQKMVNLLTSTLALIGLLVLILLFRNYQRKKITNALLEQKVRERTAELEVNRNKLTKILKEQQFAISRATSVLTEKVNTIKGLCSTGHKEVVGNIAGQYFTKIDAISHDLQTYLRESFGETGSSSNSRER